MYCADLEGDDEATLVDGSEMEEVRPRVDRRSILYYSIKQSQQIYFFPIQITQPECSGEKKPATGWLALPLLK